ncbi:MAG: hypothetical protein U0324_18290 [Polyangiales bacterium]
MTDAPEALPSDRPITDLVRDTERLRARHFDALVQLFMAVRDEDVDPNGTVAWDRIAPRASPLPVTEEAVRAWLAGKPPRAALSCLWRALDPRDPRRLTRASLVAMAAEVHPDALPEWFSGFIPHDPLFLALFPAAGEALGHALARRLVASPHASYAPVLRVATDAACAAYLRGAAAAMSPHEFGQAGAHLAARGGVTDDVRAAYGEALVALAGRLTDRHARELFVHVSLADVGALEAALRAAGKRPKVWARLAGLLASQGLPQGAAALAALLDDKKHASHAAAALGSMGATGADAAGAWRDAKGATSPRGAALADALRAIPLAQTTLWEGHWRSLPRFGRAPREDLLASPGEPAPARHEPTPLATLEAALTESPVAALLPPEGWADLLQVVALDPHLTNVPHAWARAQARGLLGLGADRAAMAAALDVMNWEATVTRHHPVHSHGVGHLLLWAGADREVFRHAIARFEETSVLTTLGARERHFTKALELVQPRWAPQVLTLLRHLGANRDETAWLGPPPVLASLASPAASAELAAPVADLWITGRVEGASRFTLTFRGDVRVTIDVAAERWQISGPLEATGATPPLDPARGVRFTVETARDVMALGIDGATVSGMFNKVPPVVGPVSITAEGGGARVTELTVHAKYTVRAADAVGELFLDLDAAQGHAEVAGIETPAAARTLAAVALLEEGARAELAKAALAKMKAPGLEPWKEAAAGGVKVDAPEAPTKRKKKADAPEVPASTDAPPPPPPAPEEFTVRSFEDVVRAFHDARLGVKAKGKKPAEFKRGQTERGTLEYASWAPKPAVEDWGARSVVPYPAVYLGDEAPSFDEPEYFVDAIADLPAVCQKGRGTMADGAFVAEEGRFFLASFEVTPPEGYDDWNSWSVAAAAWKVDEGWAWAVMEGPADRLLPFVHLRVLPPQIAWKPVRRPLGNW